MATRTRRDMQRWARRGSTEQRGYGGAHKALREQRLLAYRPGDLCAHGRERLTWWPLSVARRFLDLPHNADRSGYLPGLACRTHNRQDGQRMTTAILNARRGTVPQPQTWQAARQW